MNSFTNPWSDAAAWGRAAGRRRRCLLRPADSSTAASRAASTGCHRAPGRSCRGACGCSPCPRSISTGEALARGKARRATGRPAEGRAHVAALDVVGQVAVPAEERVVHALVLLALVALAPVVALASAEARGALTLAERRARLAALDVIHARAEAADGRAHVRRALVAKTPRRTRPRLHRGSERGGSTSWPSGEWAELHEFCPPEGRRWQARSRWCGDEAISLQLRRQAARNAGRWCNREEAVLLQLRRQALRSQEEFIRM